MDDHRIAAVLVTVFLLAVFGLIALVTYLVVAQFVAGM